MKVYAPNKNANGIYANTVFVNGVGETDNENAIRYFRKHGYIIEEPDRELVESANPESGSDVQTEIEPNYADMSVEELRNWMKAHGFGREIRNIQNKEKLLEIIRRK